MQLGKIREVELREVLPNEAQSCTHLLAGPLIKLWPTSESRGAEWNLQRYFLFCSPF
jgi:hypothetical protein